MKNTALLVSLALLIGGNAMAYEEAAYQVAAEGSDYEIRDYEPYLVAETTVEGDFRGSGNAAFRRLFKYISGANRQAAKVAMTTPVASAEVQGAEIAMTIPVVSTPASEASKYVYQFVMPAEYTLETLPAPTDPLIQIRQVPARRVAAHRFSGFWSEGNYNRAERTLLEALKADGVEATGEPVFARYNGPFTLWFWRRNEVMVEIAN